MPTMDAALTFSTFRQVKRSKPRRFLGRLLYRLSRYAQWHLSGQRYARRHLTETLPVECASHKTPLIRNLANADMWLQRNKITNLRLAAKKLNGIVILPGETFSFWKTVGNPTKRKGYLQGMVLDGGKMRPGTGGGLCQSTNLIYWMALHTPLQVTERYRHSYDVFPDADRTQPFGSGATCSYNRLDLQIKNGTKEPYQLSLKLTEDHLAGCWRTTRPDGLRYEVYEKEHRILSNAWGGYIRHNTIWRKTFDGDGEMIRDEFVAENNALMMYQPYLGEGVADY